MGEVVVSDAEDGSGSSEAVGRCSSSNDSSSSTSRNGGEKQKLRTSESKMDEEKSAILCQCSTVLDPFTPKENAR